MPKVKIRPGCGKHRDRKGRVFGPGDEVEVTEAQAAAFADKFEKSLSATELADLAKAKAAEAEAEAEQAAKKAEADKKAAADAAAAAKAGDKAKG